MAFVFITGQGLNFALGNTQNASNKFSLKKVEIFLACDLTSDYLTY